MPILSLKLRHTSHSHLHHNSQSGSVGPPSHKAFKDHNVQSSGYIQQDQTKVNQYRMQHSPSSPALALAAPEGTCHLCLRSVHLQEQPEQKLGALWLQITPQTSPVTIIFSCTSSALCSAMCCALTYTEDTCTFHLGKVLYVRIAYTRLLGDDINLATYGCMCSSIPNGYMYERTIRNTSK